MFKSISKKSAYLIEVFSSSSGLSSGFVSSSISIDQKTTNTNPRSTVGTVTEIYDYFRLLYARIGIPHCPKCGKEIKKQEILDLLDALMKPATVSIIHCPGHQKGRDSVA